MVQLVLRGGHVVAYHPPEQDVANVYSDRDGYEIVEWHGDTSFLTFSAETPRDPRTPAQRAADAARAAERRLLAKLPDAKKLLYILYKEGLPAFSEAIDEALK